MIGFFGRASGAPSIHQYAIRVVSRFYNNLSPSTGRPRYFLFNLLPLLSSPSATSEGIHCSTHGSEAAQYVQFSESSRPWTARAVTIAIEVEATRHSSLPVDISPSIVYVLESVYKLYTDCQNIEVDEPQ